MSGAHDTTVGGEALTLLPERAVWWQARSTLLVADAHFGKAATLRAHGIPVPRGSSSAALARLHTLIDRYDAQRVVFLGDFLHTRHSRGEATSSALRNWRKQRPHVALQLVLGNHDRHAGRPADDLRIEIIAESLVIGPFVLRHLPIRDPRGYVLAGHLHPAIRLHGAGHDSVQVPCFVFGAELAVLPAFGELTGTSLIPKEAHQRVFACAGERVLPLPDAVA